MYYMYIMYNYCKIDMIFLKFGRIGKIEKKFQSCFCTEIKFIYCHFAKAFLMKIYAGINQKNNNMISFLIWKS